MTYAQIRNDIKAMRLSDESLRFSNVVTIAADARQAKPSNCPYCQSCNIRASHGRWECGDCDREGSY